MAQIEKFCEFPLTLYCVYERTSYKHFPTGRYGVGPYYVEQVSAMDPRELLKKMGHCTENFIDENIFYSEEANQAALEKTIAKLEQVPTEVKDCEKTQIN